MGSLGTRPRPFHCPPGVGIMVFITAVPASRLKTPQRPGAALTERLQALLRCPKRDASTVTTQSDVFVVVVNMVLNVHRNHKVY